MKRLFGKFGFREISYDRPNQQWVCGRECEGKGCPFGPDLKGDCQATHECIPVKQEDRWTCNRTRQGSEISPCEEGPSPEGECCRPIAPCSPRRSLRAKRGILVLSTIALSLGVILLLLSNPSGTNFMNPGELTHAHSSANSKCVDCHEIGKGMPIDWMHEFTGKGAAPDSQQCLKCHALGDQPMNPHSLPLAVLADSRSRILADAADTEHHRPTGLQVAALGFAPDNLNQSKMACSACHVEHQGKDHDLKTLSNARCQVCHAVQFKTFAEEHPPFGNYPFNRRTRIVFDHVRHLKYHFQEKQFQDLSPKDCRDCHSLDERGELMITKGYESSCAACHQKDFSGFSDDAPSIPFLRIPLMDVDSMEEAELNIGEWPDDWDSLETMITPFTEFLLQHSTNHRHAVHRMVDKDLDMIEEEDWKHGFDLAWGIKELMHDISEQGIGEFERRIGAALERKLTRAEKTALEETMSPSLFANSASHWFPKLADEVKAHREGDSPESAFMDPDDMEDRLATEPVALGGNWIRSDTDLTIHYRPAHHADPFMKIWLELASKGAHASGTNATEHAKTNAIARLSQSLSGSAAASQAGRCMKCHTTEPEQPGKINWQGLRPDHQRHRFSKFSHQAHFSLLDQRGCVTCHQLRPGQKEEPYLASFAYHLREAEEKVDFASNFKAIDHATCASCHTEKLAGGDCLTCHNYHIGEFDYTLLKGRTFRHLHEQEAAAKKDN